MPNILLLIVATLPKLCRKRPSLSPPHVFNVNDLQRFRRLLGLAALLHFSLFIIAYLISSSLEQLSPIKIDSKISNKITANIVTEITRIPVLSAPPSPIEGIVLIRERKQGVVTPPNPMTRTISATNHEAKDAAYLSRWQAYIEKFGNEHYPRLNRDTPLTGTLRLMVAIKQNGTLASVSIRQSSGSAVLDEAALDIVRQAAPFEPFPPEIAQGTEMLEIIRTCEFRGKLFSSA